MRTPSGAIATVVSVDSRLNEALVQFDDGEFAHFRMALLRTAER